MHTYQQSASTKNVFSIFIHVITRKLIYFIDYQIPTAKIKITNTKVNTLDTL